MTDQFLCLVFGIHIHQCTITLHYAQGGTFGNLDQIQMKYRCSTSTSFLSGKEYLHFNCLRFKYDVNRDWKQHNLALTFGFTHRQHLDTARHSDGVSLYRCTPQRVQCGGYYPTTILDSTSSDPTKIQQKRLMKETHHSPSKERYPTSIKKLAHYWQMGPCELFKQRPTCRHPLPDSSNVLNSGPSLRWSLKRLT
jgi:hypothetical protein